MSLPSLFVLAAIAALPEGAPRHPPIVAPTVTLPNVAASDRDLDRIDDRLFAQASHLPPGQVIKVELGFRRPVTQAQLDAFVKLGGELEWVFQSLSHGFVGKLPASALKQLPNAVGRDSLLLVAGNDPMHLDLDKATRNARSRAAWAPGFAGSALGFNGTPTTTIGIIDTGIDETHSDLTGRMAYWKDFQGTATAPEDFDGHGSCVASIALGSGAAFEATSPILKYTRSSTFAGLVPSSVSGRNPLAFDPSPITINVTGIFDGAEQTKLAISSSNPPVAGNRAYNTLFSSTGASPVVLTSTFIPTQDRVYSIGLTQSPGGLITWGTVVVQISPYPSVADGLPTMRGVAPGCKWAAAHAADDVTSVEEALDDLMTQRQALNLKVINISQSPDTMGASLLPAKIASLVQGGVVVVKTAGNQGRSASDPFITPSGLVALEITVGATNDTNQLTSYTSVGKTAFGAGEELKPDLVAPGGSLLGVDMLCADSNDADQPDGGIPDQVANDYVPEEGTSFAAPIVAGSAALVIQALEASGFVWEWNDAVGPKKVKAALLSTATETNQVRENPPSPNPGLGRATAQKDINEGYGILNVDAAIESLTVELVVPSNGSTLGSAFDRRAWGRKIALTAGTPVVLNLSMPPNGDFDLYLYGDEPDAAGNPVLRASAAVGGVGVLEALNFTPTVTETGHLVVKRISGLGSWSLVVPSICGNGKLEASEDCDDGNATTGDCCSPTCKFEPTNQQCPKGACKAGRCVEPLCGDGFTNFPETCDDGNTRSGDCCSSICQLEADGSLCPKGACQAGRCVVPIVVEAIPGSTSSGPAAKSCGVSGLEGLGGLWLLASLLRARRRR